MININEFRSQEPSVTFSTSMDYPHSTDSAETSDTCSPRVEVRHSELPEVFFIISHLEVDEQVLAGDIKILQRLEVLAGSLDADPLRRVASRRLQVSLVVVVGGNMDLEL
ncbi:GSCOCG00010205001-RA-CDS [Cotesia congregata]|nr:GSCOCG00010205001-RA-CDS [Cotesia congregata]